MHARRNGGAPSTHSTADAPARRALPLPADAVQLHLVMLEDRGRTGAYIDAIRRTVRVGDVVLDIGTGTGVLAIAAAQQGARRVYAVESGGVRRCARRLIAANGLEDRITVIPGWSGGIRLPERCDVLVSEVIGNEPLSEGVVAITRDACRRLLKPGARLVPRRVSLLGLPVFIPPEALAKLTFLPEKLERWRKWYGIDFGPLASLAEPQIMRHFVNPKEMGGWDAVTEPIRIADIDLRRPPPRPLVTYSSSVAERDGVVNGFAVFFELSASSVFLSTAPGEVGEDNHWESPVQLLAEPLVVSAGDTINVGYRYAWMSQLSSCRIWTEGAHRP
jgi:hypothetical protein